MGAWRIKHVDAIADESVVCASVLGRRALLKKRQEDNQDVMKQKHVRCSREMFRPLKRKTGPEFLFDRLQN